MTDPMFVFFDSETGDFTECRISALSGGATPITDSGDDYELFGISLSSRDSVPNSPLVAANVELGSHLEVMFAFDNDHFKSIAFVKLVVSKDKAILQVTVNRNGEENVTDVVVS